MALEGLYLKDEGEAVSTDYPCLREMLDYICKQQPRLLESEETRDSLIFPSKTYMAMIDFLMKCFLVEFTQEDSRTTDKVQASVVTFCSLLEHAMASKGSVELHAKASRSILAIASYFPQVFMPKFLL